MVPFRLRHVEQLVVLVSIRRMGGWLLGSVLREFGESLESVVSSSAYEHVRLALERVELMALEDCAVRRQITAIVTSIQSSSSRGSPAKSKFVSRLLLLLCLITTIVKTYYELEMPSVMYRNTDD